MQELLNSINMNALNLEINGYERLSINMLIPIYLISVVYPEAEILEGGRRSPLPIVKCSYWAHFDKG